MQFMDYPLKYYLRHTKLKIKYFTPFISLVNYDILNQFVFVLKRKKKNMNRDKSLMKAFKILLLEIEYFLLMLFISKLKVSARISKKIKMLLI